MFATADWDEPYWTNKQHCATELAKLGIDVLYIESVGLRAPRPGSSRDWKRLKDRLFKGIRSLIFGAPQRALNIRVLSPLLIPGGYCHPLTRCLNRCLLKAAIWRNQCKNSAQPPLIWTYHPFMMDIFSSWKGSPLLYHCVDDIAAVPGVDADAFRSAEQVLLQRADVVFATAPVLADHCRSINSNTHFLPNVVDAEHFGKSLEPGWIPDDIACIPEPRLGYHGVLSDFKIDFQLLLDAARLKPEWSWVFIGDEREGQKSPLVAELAKLPNVHFLGYRSYNDLPSYLRWIQVGLLPSLINEYTRSMFPMKYFEYLAAGVPVVSTGLDFSKSFDFGMEKCSGAAELISAVSKQLQRGRFSKVEVESLVNNNTWKARMQKMLSALYGI